VRLPDLIRSPDSIAALSPEAVIALLGELETIRAQLWARLLASPNSPATAAAEEADRLLSAKEVADLIGVSVRWVYRHQRRFPFTRRMSRKVVKFSPMGLRNWLAEQRGGRKP
jgi:predicted DNA-binding transcriptional regulator AlpA